MATANTAIKITSLPNIGNNIAPSTLIPVVNMAGAPVTQKANLQITGNLILAGAGTANFVPAGLANLAYSVVNAAQPNITSTGTLNVNTLKVSGGVNGQYIQTDGTGNLAWVSGGGSGNGEVGGSDTQIQYNNAGNFDGNPGLTWDASNNQLNTVNFAASSATIYGNVNAINVNASGNIIPNAIYTDHYYYANGYVFGGGGNGTPGGANTQVQFNNNGAFGGQGNFTYDAGNNILNVIRANVSYLTAYTSIDGGNSVVANYFIGSGANLTNIAGANVSGFVPNANIANTAFAVAAANVIGLGNIATLSLSGSSSNVLYGNGVFAPAAGGGGNGSPGGSDTQVQFNDAGDFGGDADFTYDAGNNILNVIRANVSYLTAYNSIIGDSLTVEQDVSGNGALRLQGIAGGNSTINIGGEADIDVVANIGNINLYTANNQPWIFDQDGNLTLPGNTFAVNYANGTQVSIGGGGANTGNVTFDNQIVIGTGSNDGGGGLYLAPGNASIANSAVQYLRVRGGDYPTHIHLDTGNNEYYDQYFGADSRYVKLEANGNVVINADDYAGNGATWNFDTDGNLTLPNDANIAIYGNTTQFNTCPNGFLGLNSYDAGGNNIARVGISSADKLVGIGVSDPITEQDYNWTFTNGGGTIFPTLTVDLHNGGNQQAQTLQFGNSSQQAIITGPTPPANINAQRLIIQGQRGNGTGEGGDVYFWAGDADTNGGDIKIYAGDSDGATGSGGYINLTGGDGADNAGYINIDGGYSSNGYGGYVNIIGGSSGSGIGGNIQIQAGQSGGGNINGANILLQGGYSQSANGGAVTVRGGQSALGLLGYGNVLVEAGSSQWVFDNTGNLTLPTNTFAVNYANGTPVSIGGGGANTGNVTFDDVTVQGVNGLNLSAGSDFTANLAYLQVRAGDVASHIHLDTGNNQAYDLILGDDQNYVQVSSTGNILLSAYDSNTNQYTWTLDYNGNLILAGGNSVIQSIANSSLDILNPNVSTMVLTPDPGYSSQALVLDPTLVGHIHLRSPGSNIDQPSANLFLGGEASSFEVGQYNGAVPNLFIHSNNYTWTFDIDGNLTLPQLTTISDESEIGTTLTIGVPPTVIVISGADFSPVNTTYTKTGAATPTWEPAGYNPATDPYIEFSGGEYGIFNPGFGQALYVNSGTLNKPLTQWNTNPPLGSVAPTAVYTYGASGPDWVFGTDGNLTLPGNLIIAGNTSVFGTNSSLLQTTDDLPLIAISSGANGAVSSVWVEDVANVGTSNIAAVYANPTVGSGIVRIAVGQNGGNAGPNLWDFNANGTTIFPGDLIGNGASPAPSISGFNSISALTFTNGNSNVTVTANATSWTFGTNGNLTLPEGGIVTNNIPLVTFDILYQYDDLEWDGITVTFTNASSTYMLGVLALMQAGDPITLVGPGGAISTTVAIPYTGGSAGYFTVTEANSPIQITQFTLPNRLTSVNGVTLTTNARNYLFTEAGVTQSPVLTVDTLPSGQYAVAGFRAFVSDANLAPVGNFGEIVGNSGSNTVCVWCDGTNWRIG